MNGIGFSSVHITDTKEEVLRVSHLLCNDNGIHYLNNAKIIKRKHVSCISGLLEWARQSNIDPESFIVDGSYLLELYGVRRADDLDIIAMSHSDSVYNTLDFDDRSTQLFFHCKTADDIVCNPENYFSLFGLKFIGFNKLIAMKERRGEAKDVNDLRLSQAVNDKSSLLILKARVEQKVLYSRIIAKRNLFKYTEAALKSLGLYQATRKLYRSFRYGESLFFR